MQVQEDKRQGGYPLFFFFVHLASGERTVVSKLTEHLSRGDHLRSTRGRHPRQPGWETEPPFPFPWVSVITQTGSALVTRLCGTHGVV